MYDFSEFVDRPNGCRPDIYVTPGVWEVFQKESNKPAQAFWHNVVDAYTKGRFTNRLEDGRRIQGFET